MKISGNIIDILNRRIFPGEVTSKNSKIISIKNKSHCDPGYLLPGLIDAHVHIESSMITPAAFAHAAVKHGTIATVSDPHEIANIMGVDGIDYMIKSGQNVPFKFFFGAPSCVPATILETSGAVLNEEIINSLLGRQNIYFLSEMMNFPGVIMNDEAVLKKIQHAKHWGKVIDGHAPGVTGKDLDVYCSAGITTDHECSTLEEAKEKISKGMKILIREGSAARNMDALLPLVKQFPAEVMFCTDDLHPDDLVKGHINLMVKRALESGAPLLEVLTAACVNPVFHYHLPVGLLKEGDPADFIVIDHPDCFHVLKTIIGGRIVFENGRTTFDIPRGRAIHKMFQGEVTPEQILVPAKGKHIRLIEAIDGELITKSIVEKAPIRNDFVVTDTHRDILKIVVKDRYSNRLPATGFIRGFKIREGAVASSIAHDSHHVIAIGSDDQWILTVLNQVISSGGGISIAGSQGNLFLPLPVAGLMSLGTADQTAEAYKEITRLAKAMGSTLRAPIMTLSFMALLVIPELKISERGLFDVNQFKYTSLFVE
jgi:adenine deaminase